jgi:Leucine-rich repeat (LRR) protein
MDSKDLLSLTYRNLTKLPDLSIYPNCKILMCYHNKLTSLDHIPFGLKKLDCSYNNLTSLDYLPLTLEKLDCSYNNITSLDNLPLTLRMLNCYNNPIKYNFQPILENIIEYNHGQQLKN